MKIDIRSKDCLFVEIDEWTFYIDNSTDEAIIEKWVTGTNEDGLLSVKELADMYGEPRK